MNNETVELSFFSDAIIRRWYLPLGLAIVGALIGLQLRPEPGPALYEAESRLLIRPVTDAVLDSNLRVDQIINEDTEAQLAASELVATGALELLGDGAPPGLDVDALTERLDVTVRPDSQIVVVSFRDEDPGVAGAVTDAVAASYLDARTRTALTERDGQAAVLAAQISQLTRDLTSANVVIATADARASARASLEGRIARLEEVAAIDAIRGEEPVAVGDPIGALRAELDALPAPVDPAELAAAETDVELITGQIADLREELIALATIEIDGGEVIQRAGLGEAVAPRNGLVEVAIGALAGLVLGLAIAVLVERTIAARGAAATLPPGARPMPDHVFAVDDPAAAPDPRTVGEPATAGAGRGNHPGPGRPDATRWPVVHEAVAPRLGPEAHPRPQAPSPTLRAVDAPRPDEVRRVAPRPAEGRAVPLYDQDRDAAATVAQPATTSAHAVDTDQGADPNPAGPVHATHPDHDNTVAALADVPRIPRSAHDPVVVTSPASEPAIALRRVARVVQSSLATVTTPVVLVTSPHDHEGKTTVASNVAAALRQDGLSVLLVTRSHQRVVAPGVHVLPPGMQLGPDGAYPDSERLRELMTEAEDLVDVVVFDGPSMLTDPDAERVASVADAAVIVAVSGRTSATDVATAKLLLEARGTDVLGLVTTARPSWLVRRLSDRGADGEA